jgi:hypothetical protein
MHQVVQLFIHKEKRYLFWAVAAALPAAALVGPGLDTRQSASFLSMRDLVNKLFANHIETAPNFHQTLKP